MREPMPLDISIWFWRLAGASSVMGLALFCGLFVEEQAQARRMAMAAALQPRDVVTLSAEAPEASQPAVPVAMEGPCAPHLTVAARDGAMLSVTVEAGCAAGHRIELDHAGLTLAETMPVGRPLHLLIPALEARGRVAVRLADGTLVASQAAVPDLDRYRRFAISWQGAASAWLVGPDGEGWVTDLGDAKLASPLRAQVFTRPARRQGQVTVTVAATPDSCGAKLKARTIVARGGTAEATALSVDLPQCGQAPAVMHLKNLDRETTLAQG